MGLTISDVARAAKVSTATVSRYLNQPQLVSPDRQERISRAITDLNYVPNNMAKALTTNHSSTIGVIVPDINNIYYPPIVRGIEDYLTEHGYISFLCNTDQNIQREKRYITTLRSQQVAGMIFVGSRPTDPSLSAHLPELRQHLPLIMINEDMFEGKISSIGNREEDGIYQLIQYLYSLGHRRIAFINSTAALTTYQRKEKGYCNAMKQFGISNTDGWIYRDEKEYEIGGYSAMKKILGSDIHPSAIVSATDQMAVGAVHALLEQGYRMPKDYSVVGYSNSCAAAATYPGITTIDQFGYKLGKTAARLLLPLIRGGQDDFAAHYLDTRLIIRKSSGFCITS